MRNITKFVSLLVKTGFAILGGWWTLVEILKDQGLTVPSFIVTPWYVLGFSAICATFLYLLPLFKVIKIKNSDRELCLRPGNVLRKKNASVVVGINDTLSCDESDIGENSIHHQLLKSKIKNEVLQCFENQKEPNQQTKWEYGYIFTCEISHKKKSFVFLVMSSLNNPGTVLTTPQALQHAIIQLFKNENEYPIKNRQLILPLIGTGSAGVSMTKYDVIKVISCAYCSATTAECHGIDRLTIQIRWRDYLKMNIHGIIESLQWLAENCCCLYN